MWLDVLTELGDWTMRAGFAVFFLSAGLLVIGGLALFIAVALGGLR